LEKVGSDSEPLDQRDQSRIRQPGNSPIKSGSFGNGREIIDKGWIPTCTCFPETPELISHDLEIIKSHTGTPHRTIPCTVLDPFMGAATTLLVADKLGRNSLGIELNPEYVEIAEKRLEDSRRERFAPWQDQHIPIESAEEIPDSIEFSKLFGN